MSVHDTRDESVRDASLQAATEAVRAGDLIVLPTDTVYGVGCDAFDASAVDRLLEAKGRGREVPPPVLVGDPAVLHALAIDVEPYVEDLAEAFWPGALTLIVRAQPSLTWDLGETRGTVALRMPDNTVALEVLKQTGPLAVTSANRHGKPAATTVLDAATQLGDAVSVYLDGGTSAGGTASTIIDTTVSPAEIVREGALSHDQIVAAVGDIFSAPEPEETPGEDAAAQPDAHADAGEQSPVGEARSENDDHEVAQPAGAHAAAAELSVEVSASPAVSDADDAPASTDLASVLPSEADASAVQADEPAPDAIPHTDVPGEGARP